MRIPALLKKSVTYYENVVFRKPRVVSVALFATAISTGRALPNLTETAEIRYIHH
jgi:hypothetical protein